MKSVDWKKLGINVGLAFLAAFSASILATEGDFTISLIMSAGYAGIRGAAGYVTSVFGKAIPVDE